MIMAFGEFESISPTGGVVKNYEPNHWERQEALEPLISFESVLATQAMIMKILKTREHSVLRRNKSHGFAALNNLHSDDGAFYDGSSEEYLSCRVAKVDYDQWTMRVRFRENVLTEAEKNKSYIDDYSFDWISNGNLQAWRGSYQVTSLDDVTHEEWRHIQPIRERDIEELNERVDSHMFGAVAAQALHSSRRSEHRTLI